MPSFLILLKSADNQDMGLGDYEFASIPRRGEFLSRVVHEEFDKDEAPVAECDVMKEGMRRRIYKVEAVVHLLEPIIENDDDSVVPGYLIVRNAGSSHRLHGRRLFRLPRFS